MAHYTLETPVTEAQVRALRIGDTVTLEKTLFGIRDANLIAMFDQGRRTKSGELYKTRNNHIHDNDMKFEGAVCAGAASDVGPDNANADVIETGNNRFDHNIYRISRGSTPVRFAWGRAVLDWDRLQHAGLEQNGSLLVH